LDCDICAQCGEHTGFEEDPETGDLYSQCCGSGALNTDPDVDMER